MKNRINILTSPFFLSALTVLFINDFILKDLFPGFVTGKLSDFAGLIVFPLFIFFLIGKWKKHIFVLTALLFIFWKSSFSASLIGLFNSLSPLQVGRVVDYSDLFALLMLPIAYYIQASKTVLFRNPALKTLVVLFTLFCILASETTEIRFTNEVKGYIPFELEGDYLLHQLSDKQMQKDTISFIRLRKSTFLILENYRDTLYEGQIHRKKGDYYLNQYKKETKSWAINCFRLKGDSIYNFEYSFWGIQNTELIKKNFENIRISKDEDQETWYVDNRKKETLKAFDKLLNESKGLYFKEIIEESDTLIETIQAFEEQSASDLANVEIKVYPNPFVDYITIEHQFQKPLRVNIINNRGQIVYKTEIKSDLYQWNLSSLKAGVYSIVFYSNNNQLFSSLKIIKK